MAYTYETRYDNAALQELLTAMNYAETKLNHANDQYEIACSFDMHDAANDASRECAYWENEIEMLNDRLSAY